jgi:CO dehydrogenase/acetyl-CoA synthase alpha subunit
VTTPPTSQKSTARNSLTVHHRRRTPTIAVPVLLNPDRQQQRRVIVADQVRTAWKEDAREDADVEPEPVLMKKTVLGGELDVAPTDIGAAANRPVKSFRQGSVNWRSGAAP